MQVNFENARRVIQGFNKNHTFDGVGRDCTGRLHQEWTANPIKFYNGLKNTLFGKSCAF